MTTKIEWATETWNPQTGCTPISEGCAHCYAQRMAKRLAGRCGYPEAPHQFDVTEHPGRLAQPGKWQKPRRIFVGSMTDVFHNDTNLTYMRQILLVIMDTPRHTYMMLTKRARIMKLCFNAWSFYECPETIKNLWLGITAENQARFNERWADLAAIDAAVRFVSLEPLLGPIDLGNARPDWVIVGGETGPGARPLHPDWVYSLRDQCQEKGIPFFFKSWGYFAYMPMEHNSEIVSASLCRAGRYELLFRSGKTMIRPLYNEGNFGEIAFSVGKKYSGDTLDGIQYHEFPQGENNDTH